jgi:hypothetical protein
VTELRASNIELKQKNEKLEEEIRQLAGAFELRVGGLAHPRGARTAVQAFKPLGLAHELARLHWLGVRAATFRRGLVERIDRCAEAFERFAAPLFRTYPILDVRLADREPALDGPAGDKVPVWFHPRRGFPGNSLPKAVWPLSDWGQDRADGIDVATLLL